MLSSKQILDKYFSFLGSKGHKQIPNVSVVPQEDSTLLFVNSGMFPLVPYLMGEPHPLGTRLMNVQRSIRFEDIEEVGLDIRHTTAFHMIGNWSLGDYFKKEQLEWIYEFFIKELGLPPEKLYATVFAGDEKIPKDEESIEILKQIFAKYGIEAKEGERIFTFGRKSNWWQRGDAIGELGGPDSEIFYYLGEKPPKPGMNPETHEDLFLEIGNSVFMQYVKTKSGWEPLKQKNVDFGGGLERIAMIVQQKYDIFYTDMFYPIIQALEKLTGKAYKDHTYHMRVIADHMRAATIIAMDGVIPSNKDQGYVLRRLLRRMIRFGWHLGVDSHLTSTLLDPTVEMLKWLYPWWQDKKKDVSEIFDQEESKFNATLKRVQPKVDKYLSTTSKLDENQLAQIAFDLYQSDGYPPEIFIEDLKHKNIKFDEDKFKNLYSQLFEKHKQISRKGAEKKFKGGLAAHTDTIIKYHTATHLLHAALTELLGPQIHQKGSNITNERLRFDFPYDKPLTEEQIRWLENWVNSKINEGLPVQFVVLPLEKAKKLGAKYIPGEKYPAQVKVYFIGESLDKAVSIEFCGGPHVKNTKEIPPIEIYKQESVGKGVRRVYARFRK